MIWESILRKDRENWHLLDAYCVTNPDLKRQHAESKGIDFGQSEQDSLSTFSTSYVTLGMSLNHIQTQFLHLENWINSTDLIGILWRWNGIINIKCLVRSLVHI